MSSGESSSASSKRQTWSGVRRERAWRELSTLLWPKRRRTTMLRRRRLLICVATFLVTDVAHAQKYPAQPIQVLVANGPGSASDVGTRVVLSKMATSLGQPAVIINRPGAGGGLAAQAIAKAVPDGYTLLMATDGTYTAIPLTNKAVGYDLNSATTIGAIAEIHSVLLVSATLNV